MDNSLCCVINPVHDCWKCSTKLCKAHSNYSVDALYWCEACHDLDEDSYMMMSRYQERLEDASAAFDEVMVDLETIGDHSARCKTCRASMYCDELESLSALARDVHRKYSRRTF